MMIYMVMRYGDPTATQPTDLITALIEAYGYILRGFLDTYIKVQGTNEEITTEEITDRMRRYLA